MREDPTPIPAELIRRQTISCLYYGDREWCDVVNLSPHVIVRVEQISSHHVRVTTDGPTFLVGMPRTPNGMPCIDQVSPC